MKLCNTIISKTVGNVLSPNSYPLYLWEIYIFRDRSVYFAAAKYVDRSCGNINRSQIYECRNWDWGRAIPFLGINKLYFRFSVWPVGSRSPGRVRCGWCSGGVGSCGTPPLSRGAAARRRRVAATHVQPADMRTSLNIEFLKHYEEIDNNSRVFYGFIMVCQCLGSGSVVIWLSWIRIRIGNPNPDPD